MRMSQAFPPRHFFFALLSTLPAFPAAAQLTPDRLYYGVGRPLPMTVKLPEGTAAAPAIRLIAPVTLEIVATGAAAPGLVNLATMFPDLWTASAARLLYAQLVAGDAEIGAPVVLQPMIGPRTPVLAHPATGQAWWIDEPSRSGPDTAPDAKGKPAFEAREGVIRYYHESPLVYAGIRAYVDQRVVLETSEGEIEFALRPDAAPNTAFNFLHLVEGGFYTDIVFHRVVPVALGFPFVIQVGDPTGGGDGGPGYSIDLEPSTLPHDFGVISMARDSDPNTNGSQVFVCLSREGTARLDGRYTAFGRAVRGAEAIRAIAGTPLREGTDKPIDAPVLRRARLVDAPPFKSARRE